MCLCRGGLITPPKQILHIIDLNLKKILAVRIATWSDSVCHIRIGTQPQDKSHATSGHMESSTSVYMVFHFCRIHMPHTACMESQLKSINFLCLIISYRCRKCANWLLNIWSNIITWNQRLPSCSGYSKCNLAKRAWALALLRTRSYIG